jgi:hypothetical protein
VPTTRATVIDPASVSAESQARTWLTQLDALREAHAAAATLNHMLHAHRLANADPHMREISPWHALVVRAGWGDGEQVAYGRWLYARELRLEEHRTRRSAALRSHERFAALLGAREQALPCEELTLRARLDLDAGRLPHAALELEHAYAAALVELTAEQRPDLAERLAELGELHAGVIEAAHAALGEADSVGRDVPNAPTVQQSNTPAVQQSHTPAADRGNAPAILDEETIRHALDRLEAALRARAALG